MLVACEKFDYAHVVQAHERIGRVVRHGCGQCIARACRHTAAAHRQRRRAQSRQVGDLSGAQRGHRHRILDLRVVRIDRRAGELAPKDTSKAELALPVD